MGDGLEPGFVLGRKYRVERLIAVGGMAVVYEAVNTAMTYGYDIVTMMQETKTSLCQVAKA